eukprot:5705132-Amphidinium_carterae.1
MGFRTPSEHRHEGNCCLCHSLHTRSLIAPVVRGCYRQSFSTIRALHFLAVAPPTIFLQLIVACTVDSDEGRLAVCRLGNVSLLIGEMRHA